MATGSRTTNTMSEGLRVLLQDIADMKLAPDADLPFLINIETQIVGYLKAKADEALTPPGQMGPGAGGGPMAGPPPGPPGPPGLGGMGPMRPGTGSPRGVPGLMQGPQMPNPDELRRILG